VQNPSSVRLQRDFIYPKLREANQGVWGWPQKQLARYNKAIELMRSVVDAKSDIVQR
jgi:hypothetical protein